MGIDTPKKANRRRQKLAKGKEPPGGKGGAYILDVEGVGNEREEGRRGKTRMATVGVLGNSQGGLTNPTKSITNAIADALDPTRVPSKPKTDFTAEELAKMEELYGKKEET